MDLRDSMVREMIQEDERPKWIAHSNHNIICFNKDDIIRITNNYRTILGRGGFGEVYEGVLEDDSKVAVKRFVHSGKENFAKELKVHSEVNHKNVVRLLGYCAEEDALMIVTECVPKGNLYDVLHHHGTPISLDTRLRVAVECAEALSYMHAQMYTKVIHGDIKTANILLDDHFNAKIIDFGISRLVNTDVTPFTEHIKGTFGYMDPLFARDGRLTPKSDVYSFGVVLVELITKKKPTGLRDGEVSIVENFTHALATGIRRVRELFDAEISSQSNMKVLEGVAKLAGECLRMEMDRRPKMIDVAERLRGLRKAQPKGKERLTLFSWGWKSKPEAQNNSCGLARPHDTSCPVPPFSPSNLCRHFSLAEMKAATRKFDEALLIPKTGHTLVYRGEINGGATKVAIKRVNTSYTFINRQWRFEEQIAMLSTLRHHHIVSLLGYCTEEEMLVYDYMAHGSLNEHLYDTQNQKPPLTWQQRLNICIGAARGLHYLHVGAEFPIIHRNVTSAKFFLDQSLVAKVSGLVLSRHGPAMGETHLSTRVMGTVGYIDPEYLRRGHLSEKSDVFSFGVVLFEVICAQRPTDYPNLEECPLMQRALDCLKNGIFDEIVDPHLKGKIAPRSLEKFLEIAIKCIAENGIDRPAMDEVIESLEMCLAEENESLVSGTLDEFDILVRRHQSLSPRS